MDDRKAKARAGGQPVNAPAALKFGALLRQLRRRAGLTQGELAQRVGYSVSLISRLEQGERLPAVTTVAAQFVAALELDNEPNLALRLVELAAEARGERPPSAVAATHTFAAHFEASNTDLPGRMPAPLFALIGREHDLEVVCQRLLAAPGRLLTLLGPPGVGKTQLSLAVAAHVRTLFRDGVWFVPLAAVDDVALVAPAIATVLGLDSAGAKPALDRLIEHLRRRQMLLVLDNVEQVTACGTLLVTLLQECSSLYILTTSTQPLRLRSEQRYKTPPLTPAAAVELFTQRAQAVEPDLVVTPDDADAIARLCQRLDCLPLAIELVAARADVLTPTRLLEQFDADQLDLLSDGPHDLEPHHRTLRAAIQRSYDLLTAPEQALFRSLGVFVGAFDQAGVAALGFDAASLRSLADRSLLHRVAERYYLLETLRTYALEALAASGEECAVRQRHADYFLALAVNAAAHWRTPDQQQWLSRLDAGHDNLRAAMRWLIDHDSDAAQRMGAALSDFWFVRGHFAEARRMLDQALLADNTTPSTRGQALLAAARLAHAQDDNAAAVRLVEMCLPLLHTSGDYASHAEALRTGGWIAHSAGQSERARTMFAEALNISLSLGNDALTADLYISLAQVYALDGDEANFPTARRYFAEGMRTAQRIERPASVAYALHGLASLEFMAGDYAEATRLAQAALTSFRALDFRRNVPLALLLIGEAALLQGDLTAARTNGQMALDLYCELDSPWGVAAARQLIGHVELGCGRLADAVAHFSATLETAQRLGDDKLTATALAALGAVAAAHGESLRAALLLAAAHRRLEQLPRFLSPGYRAAIDATVARLRAALGEDQFATLWAEGAALSLDQAVALTVGDQAYCRST